MKRSDRIISKALGHTNARNKEILCRDSQNIKTKDTRLSQKCNIQGINEPENFIKSTAMSQIEVPSNTNKRSKLLPKLPKKSAQNQPSALTATSEEFTTKSLLKTTETESPNLMLVSEKKKELVHNPSSKAQTYSILTPRLPQIDSGVENSFSPVPAMVAEPRSVESVSDSPVATPRSTLTPLGAAALSKKKSECSPRVASCSTYSPVPVMVAEPRSVECGSASPVAPPYSPLTPLGAAALSKRKSECSPIVAACSTYSPVPEMVADPRSVECGSDSPVAPPYSPLTPLAAAALSKRKSECSPIVAKCSTYSPVSEMVAEPRSVECGSDSPVAPPYSPLTPVAAASLYKRKKYTESSPVAPLYLPYTHFGDTPETPKRDRRLVDFSKARVPSALIEVTPKKTEEDLNRRQENVSPLPVMSPSTLELFDIFDAEFAFDMMETNDEIGITTAKIIDDEPTSYESIEDFNEENNDFSPDTDSDYVRDTDESETDEDVPRRSKKVVSTRAEVHFSKGEKHIKNTDSADKKITSRSTPDRGDVSVNDIEIETINPDPEVEINFVEVDCTDNNYNGRPKKGRKRKFGEYTLAERKQRKYANLVYHGKKKTVEPKVFKDYSCECSKECSKLIPTDKRKQEFAKYITLGSYEAQLMYILRCVKETPKQREYSLNGKTRSKKSTKVFARIYTICDIQVCRKMFVNTFQISPKKIDVSLKKQRSGKTLNDQRGVAVGGWNKTSQDDLNFVNNVINALPKYESHYRRDQSECLYLKTGMTINKIYQLYINELKKAQGETKKPVSATMFKREFYNNFNLRCKPLKKDTCNKCDAFIARIKNVEGDEDLATLEYERDTHLIRAKQLRQKMNDELKRAETEDTFECLTFDLEKTLPLPRIPTNIVFYKRQLWLYNCGIHAGSDGIGHCYVWVEGDAGRGAQEVGSCIVHYIKNKLVPEVKHISLWSDCCGGQNRNIKIVLILKAMLNSHSTLQSITLNYLESGHTFLPNDTDFSKIETQLKHHERIYTPDEYIKVIKESKKKKPLQVYKMQKDDFISVRDIEKKICNRKVDVSKGKVNWLKTKVIYMKKEKEHSFYMKNTDLDDFQEVYIGKKIKGTLQDISENGFSLLWPNGKEIAQAKLDDLKSMFELIPKDCLDFYKNLKGNDQIAEDVEGYNSNNLDFEVEEED